MKRFAILTVFGLLAPLAVAGCSREKGAAESTATPAGSTRDHDGSAVANAGTVKGDSLKAGDAAPEFAVKAHDGRDVKLSAYRGRSVVLYFYPKDETPGCTKQACGFRDAWADLEKKGVVLIGISGDSDESHRKFAEHHKLPFLLVSDADGKLAESYGVPFRMGYASRQTIVVAPDGRIKKVYRDVDVATHAKDVLGDVS